MVKLIKKFRDNGTPQYFLPTLYQSQTCEKTFRQLRSMGTVNFTKINFSILELLYMIRRVEALNEILHFKLFDKGVVFPNFNANSAKTKIYNLPNDEEIATALCEAKRYAIQNAKQYGMSIDPDVLENYEIFKLQESGTSEYESEEDYDGDDLDDENFDSNFCEFDDVSDVKDKFIEIESENGKKVIRKSSLVWLLSEPGSRLSNDRLKRVQQQSESSNTYSKNKRARRASQH